MKYYAVRVGRQPGIYETWSECREQVEKYSGAKHKSFEDRAAAEAYIAQQEEPVPIKKDIPAAYIDGSFSKKGACYGWGGFIEHNGRHILQGSGSNPDYLPERNIAGELLGALQAMQAAVKLGIPEINMYFDYAGIASYLNGEWQPKTPLAIYYRQAADLLGHDVKVNYIKVAGHTGIAGNEIADYLAKEAVGAKLRKKDETALREFREGGADQ